MDVVLEAAARIEERRVTVMHRVLLALLYPLGIAALCIPMAVLGKFTEVAESMEVTPPAWWSTGFEAGSTLAAVAGALGGVVILVILGRSALDAIPVLRPTSNGTLRGIRAWLPYFGPITSLGSGARTLRALSALLLAGKPLHDALRGAAPAADAARFERRFVAVAERLEQGDTIDTAWHDAPLPPSVRERAALASRGTATEAARSFEVLADDLELRHGAAVDRFIARLQPAALLFVGATVLLQAMVVFSFITFTRDVVKPW
jgi:type II secretory pathway component PulF